MADYGLTEIEKIALGIHRLEFPETSEPGPVGDVAQPDTAAQPVKPDAAPVSDAARDTGLVGSQAEQSATEESSATD